MNDPFAKAETEMAKAGYSIDKIPQELHEEHLWADGLLLWWSKHKKLPTPEELAVDMLYEWDDPVAIWEAEKVLELIQA